MDTVPWDIFKAAGFTIFGNSFTVIGGVITRAAFVEGSGSVTFALDTSGSVSGLRSGDLNSVMNTNEFGGITFTAVPAPEPSKSGGQQGESRSRVRS